jgi:molybdate transport repressor ModE-like protein
MGLHMRVELRLGGLISARGGDIALGQTFALLDGIAEERSVSGAASRLGLSYRAAWGRIGALERTLGRPVAVKTKGHGSVLTEFGAGFREALGATLRAFDPLVRQQEKALQDRLAALTGESPGPARLALSHDPLLLDALSRLPNVATQVVGSEEAVRLLLRGAADLAGFHTGGIDPSELPAFVPVAESVTFRMAPLLVREQGLIVASGNPRRIRSVEDLAGSAVRFVNRQRGSGTRTWFDRLLRESGIDAGAVNGYGVEEFTHQAIGAVIAAGAADAGMAVRSVAERFGLDFIPLGREAYYLAGAPEAVSNLVTKLMPILRGMVGTAPGYSLP